MEEEKQEKNAKQLVPNSENYTIFHALVEAMWRKKRKILEDIGFYAN